MKHENPTVNYVPRNPLWDIFMSMANASALHIVTPPAHSSVRKSERLRLPAVAGDLYLILTRVNFKCKSYRRQRLRFANECVKKCHSPCDNNDMA